MNLDGFRVASVNQLVITFVNSKERDVRCLKALIRTQEIDFIRVLKPRITWWHGTLKNVCSGSWNANKADVDNATLPVPDSWCEDLNAQWMMDHVEGGLKGMALLSVCFQYGRKVSWEGASNALAATKIRRLKSSYRAAQLNRCVAWY